MMFDVQLTTKHERWTRAEAHPYSNVKEDEGLIKYYTTYIRNVRITAGEYDNGAADSSFTRTYGDGGEKTVHWKRKYSRSNFEQRHVELSFWAKEWTSVCVSHTAPDLMRARSSFIEYLHDEHTMSNTQHTTHTTITSMYIDMLLSRVRRQSKFFEQFKSVRRGRRSLRGQRPQFRIISIWSLKS